MRCWGVCVDVSDNTEDCISKEETDIFGGKGSSSSVFIESTRGTST